MKFLTFDEVGSTSDIAKNLIKEGEVPPLTVLAKRQTSGRGRSGKTWLSPEGNIYLSIVLSKEHFKDNNPSALPLAVGLSLCEYLERKFQLRLTLKWPNDILFAGKKLVGILLESSHTSDGWGNFIIGLGINLKNPPLIPAVDTISLDELTGLSDNFDKEVFAKDLVSSLTSDLGKSWDLVSRYEKYGIEKGQPWIDPKKKLFLLDGISESGSMIVASHDRKIDLHTANHDLKWAYQKKGKDSYPILCADLGNTALKLAVYSPTGEKVFYKRYSYDQMDLIPFFQLRDKYKLPEKWPVHFISVDPDKSALFSEKLNDYQYSAAELPKRSVAVDLNSYPIDQLGIDRLCIIEAMKALYPAENMVCVSLGTAMTIEVVFSDGKYQGGYIGAGPRMKLDVLHEKTGLLPKLDLRDLANINAINQPFGMDTKSSMLKSVFFETVGIVESTIKKIEEITDQKHRLVFTGGDGELFANYFKAEYFDGLVNDGIRVMILGG